MFEDDSDEFTFSHLKKLQDERRKYKHKEEEECPEMETLLDEEVLPGTSDVAPQGPDGQGPSGYTSFNSRPTQRTAERQDSEQGMPPGYHDMGGATAINMGHLSRNRGPIEAHFQDPEREETIKCVVSTILFFGIVIAIFVIAIVLNPQMWNGDTTRNNAALWYDTNNMKWMSDEQSMLPTDCL